MSRSFDVTIKGVVTPGYDMPAEDLVRVVKNLLTDFIEGPEIPPATEVLIFSVEAVPQ